MKAISRTLEKSNPRWDIAELVPSMVSNEVKTLVTHLIVLPVCRSSMYVREPIRAELMDGMETP